VDFIGKPYHPPEVLARTAVHLALARSQRALAEANGELTRTVAELNATREDLQRAEKLAALNAMVAGVAHELNTPIGNCVLAASALEQRARSFAQAAQSGLRRSELDTFIGDAQHASDLLLRNLGTTARLIDTFKQVATDQQGAVRRSFDLGEVLAQIAKALSPRLAKANVTLEVNGTADIQMTSYPGVLAEVIEQLVFNALIHGLGEATAGLVRIDASTEGSDGGYLKLVVSDNGKGIASADLGHVFEPFFTTRLGQGTGGLGLHIVHNLVANVLGGTIKAESRPGQTLFAVYCPCHAPALAGRQRCPDRPTSDT
jgi:signal transduction histidine kinase